MNKKRLKPILLVVISSFLLLSFSCATKDSDEPKSDNSDKNWNTYPAKTDLWDEYKGYLDKSPSQLETILTGKGYTKSSASETRITYRSGFNKGYLDIIFSNSLSTSIVCEGNSSIRTFENMMSYSNGLAGFPYSSYSSEIELSKDKVLSFSTRSSFLECLKSVDKNNVYVWEAYIVNQFCYELWFMIEKGDFKMDIMSVKKK